MSGHVLVLIIAEDLYFAGLVGEPGSVRGAYGAHDLVRAMMFDEGAADLRAVEEELTGAQIAFRRQYVGPVGHV